MIIHIDSGFKKEAVEVTQLSWLQKLICKWFRITPEKRYYYRVLLRTETPAYASTVIIDEQGAKWYVVESWPGNMEVANIEPLLYWALSREMAIIAQTFREGN